ncbi:MAG: hypothetical protein IKY65_03935 [Rikenellaceae bacterium]|nr:hypothetical protein [Rikenellaceae bacterium]
MSKRGIMLLVMMLTLWLGAAAQPTSTGRELMTSMVEKSGEDKGVNGMVCTKGNGLEMIKLVLRKEFGKDFIKGVDMIIIIDYSKAEQQVAEVIRTQTESLSASYEQKELPEEMTKGNYMRNFFKLNDSKEVITDMVVLVESAENKTVIYFGGEMTSPPKTK